MSDTLSGGINFTDSDANIGGDAVGRDKIVTVYNVIAPKPGSAPPLPSLIIGRDDALRELKTRLGLYSSEPIQTHMQVMTAVRGWAGVGKTTAVIALAHDAEVAEFFPDGVLWASLGTNPNLFSELMTWGRAVGNEDISRAKTLEEASALLAALLREKRMLLIVDDVWDVAHAKPFNVGGKKCAILVTTRNMDVAQAIAPLPANIYKLPVLNTKDALELLSVLAPTAVASYPEQALELVHELEGLPLALQVAGHLLHAEASLGFSVKDLLTELRAGAKILETRVPASRPGVMSETNATVAALLQQSTDRLDAVTRDCFAYLGLFAPKPATFDLQAIKAICRVEDPKPIARALVDRGLLEPMPNERFQVHAILIAHARSLFIN